MPSIKTVGGGDDAFYTFFSEMRTVTTFLSLPLASGDDGRLGNPAVDVDVVIDAAGCADMAAADHLRRKYKDSPTVRANRVLDLAEQEGLQTACIPGACDGNMSDYLKICVHISRGVVEYTDVSKDEGQGMMLGRRTHTSIGGSVRGKVSAHRHITPFVQSSEMLVDLRPRSTRSTSTSHGQHPLRPRT